MKDILYFAEDCSLAVQYARKAANCRSPDGKAAVLVVWVERERLEEMVTDNIGLDWHKVVRLNVSTSADHGELTHF